MMLFLYVKSFIGGSIRQLSLLPGTTLVDYVGAMTAAWLRRQMILVYIFSQRRATEAEKN